MKQIYKNINSQLDKSKSDKGYLEKYYRKILAISYIRNYILLPNENCAPEIMEISKLQNSENRTFLFTIREKYEAEAWKEKRSTDNEFINLRIKALFFAEFRKQR